MNLSVRRPLADNSDQASNLRALHIPDGAADAVSRLELPPWLLDEDVEAIVRAAAPAIVAAELRRLAEQVTTQTAGRIWEDLLARADELDGGAR